MVKPTYSACTSAFRRSGLSSRVQIFREAEVQADYVGFTIPNLFVVGYGLDVDENYRNRPYVGVLKPEAYMK